MNFFVDITKGTGQYSITEREDILQNDVLQLMLKETIQSKNLSHVYVSTEINKKHILVLDCDSDDKMLAAGRYLYLCKIGYCPIVSSPNHYWLITDIVDSINAVLLIAKSIPGQDPLHTDYNIKRQYISIRAYPKDDLPIFPSDLHTLTNQISIRWLNEFKTYWDSEQIKTIVELIKLRKAVEDGTVSKLAANPSFTI